MKLKLRNRLSIMFSLAFIAVVCVGCGGGVKPGVADGKEDAAPMQSPEEEAGEAASAKSAAGN